VRSVACERNGFAWIGLGRVLGMRAFEGRGQQTRTYHMRASRPRPPATMRDIRWPTKMDHVFDANPGRVFSRRRLAERKS
jgi:hypothetical protein